MSAVGWLRDRVRGVVGPPTPDVRTWHVQYDDGGRTYTYRRTEDEFRELLGERATAGRGLPHRVQVEYGSQLVEVKVDGS